jgi:hypothetical protein
MATKTNEIHELTRAEISRQISVLVDRRQQIVSERAAVYDRASKGAGAVQPLTPDERASRTHAKKLLNGSAPASLEPPPPSEINFSSLDHQLAVEQRGVDIAINILGDKELSARAAEAVLWFEENIDRWRHMVRETIIAAARLEALNAASAKLLEQCVDINAINLPLGNLVGVESFRATHGYVMPVRADDLIEAGLKAGVVTQREIDKAKNV